MSNSEIANPQWANVVMNAQMKRPVTSSSYIGLYYTLSRWKVENVGYWKQRQTSLWLNKHIQGVLAKYKVASCLYTDRTLKLQRKLSKENAKRVI